MMRKALGLRSKPQNKTLLNNSETNLLASLNLLVNQELIREIQSIRRKTRRMLFVLSCHLSDRAQDYSEAHVWELIRDEHLAAVGGE
jgi:hypothetical protein